MNSNGGKRKIGTMQELSLALGISRPTLSRYFQDPSSVRGSTSEKIRRGLERLDYVPNFFATRLNRKSSGLIGVIIPHLNDLFFTSLLDVIELAAMARDCTIITQSSRGDPAIEARAVEKLLSMNADGVIVAPLGMYSDLTAIGRLIANLPFVFVDSRLPDQLPKTDFVGTDNRQSIALITEYLCRTGDAPAFLGMPRLNSNSIEREIAYIATIDTLGFEPTLIDGDGVPEGWAFEAYAYRVMEKHYSCGRFFGATILCANDRLAIGALRAANRHGLFARVADARSTTRIAGHDDHPLSRYMTPSLTTVAQDIERIGRDAVELLVGRIQGRRDNAEVVVERLFDAVLKVRESA